MFDEMRQRDDTMLLLPWQYMYAFGSGVRERPSGSRTPLGTSRLPRRHAGAGAAVAAGAAAAAAAHIRGARAARLRALLARCSSSNRARTHRLLPPSRRPHLRMRPLLPTASRRTRSRHAGAAPRRSNRRFRARFRCSLHRRRLRSLTPPRRRLLGRQGRRRRQEGRRRKQAAVTEPRLFLESCVVARWVGHPALRRALKLHALHAERAAQVAAAAARRPRRRRRVVLQPVGCRQPSLLRRSHLRLLHLHLQRLGLLLLLHLLLSQLRLHLRLLLLKLLLCNHLC